jgi:ABC-type dipeptide/oligopeptide/nickel transport system ATPase component
MSQQLNVQNLVVDLQTEQGMARAVDALHLTLQKGQTFALVGESVCGKSMTALSLLRLLPDNAVIQNGKVNFAAAAGMGSAAHLAGVIFAQRSGIQWGYVPYKGGAQAITDLIGGQVDVTFNGMVASYRALFGFMAVMDLEGVGNKLLIARHQPEPLNRAALISRAGVLSRRLQLRVGLGPMVRKGLRLPDAQERAGKVLLDSQPPATTG